MEDNLGLPGYGEPRGTLGTVEHCLEYVVGSTVVSAIAATLGDNIQYGLMWTVLQVWPMK